MYESHWQLATKPFENTSDARFYYPSDAHQGALLKLRYALENRRSALLLSGPTGVGKTLVLHTLARQLPATFAPFVQLVFPHLPAEQLVGYIADELSGQRHAHEASTMEQNLRRLQATLHENHAAGRHAVVVLDEAHLLPDAKTLETVRLLLNLEKDSQPLLTIVLAGQPSLLPVLRRMPELDERLEAKCLLRKYTLDETAAYLQHRLQAAGASRTIFTPDAVSTIHHLAEGTPRRINRLADLSLVVGYAEELTILDVEHIEAVADELLLTTQDA